MLRHSSLINGFSQATEKDVKYILPLKGNTDFPDAFSKGIGQSSPKAQIRITDYFIISYEKESFHVSSLSPYQSDWQNIHKIDWRQKGNLVIFIEFQVYCHGSTFHTICTFRCLPFLNIFIRIIQVPTRIIIHALSVFINCNIKISDMLKNYT